MDPIQLLQEQITALIDQANAIANSAEALTTEQNQQVEDLLAQAETKKSELENRKRLAEFQNHLASPQPRAKPSPLTNTAPAIRTSKMTDEQRLDVFIATLPKGTRAINAANDVFQEAAGADGGYLLPVDKKTLISLMAPADLIHSRCDIITTTSNATSVPVDADPDWSSDLAATDVAEGAALVEDKASFGKVDALLAKSGVLVRVTREMLEDGTNIGSYITNKLARKLGWKLHAKAIAAALAAGGKITVPKTVGAPTGSAPDLANLQAMLSSMLMQNRANAVWLANPRLETSLQNLKIGDQPVYLIGGSLANPGPSKLMGLPIIFVEGMPAVGAEGDIALADFSTIWGVLKTQGPRIDSSVEAEFKNDTVLYRGYIRSVFVSKWSAPVTRPDGTTAGNVVTVATRA